MANILANLCVCVIENWTILYIDGNTYLTDVINLPSSISPLQRCNTSTGRRFTIFFLTIIQLKKPRKKDFDH